MCIPVDVSNVNLAVSFFPPAVIIQYLIRALLCVWLWGVGVSVEMLWCSVDVGVVWMWCEYRCGCGCASSEDVSCLQYIHCMHMSI